MNSRVTIAAVVGYIPINAWRFHRNRQIFETDI